MTPEAPEYSAIVPPLLQSSATLTASALLTIFYGQLRSRGYERNSPAQMRMIR